MEGISEIDLYIDWRILAASVVVRSRYVLL